MGCGLPASGDLVDAVVQVERLWYASPFRGYRDHLAHTLKVALLGEALACDPASPIAGWLDDTTAKLARGQIGQ
ncbi:MAG: hypothetical protein ABIO70_08445 [Pseudomonadota bacterium]